MRDYIQFTLRRQLATNDRTVLDRKENPTQRPTTETAFLRFAGVMGLRIEPNGEVLRQLHGLDEHCATVLEMLGVPVDVFTTVREKPLATGPPTSGM